MPRNLVSFLGIFVLIFLGWCLSEDRRRFPWRVVAWGIALQMFFGLVVLWWEPGARFFLRVNDVFNALLAFSKEGSVFVFGPLATSEKVGFIFAFQVLTTIIFFSALLSVLYYLGIMQKIVLFFAKIMAHTMGVSGAESLSNSANIFVGQTEAPLVVRPYIEKMTRSEIMAIMAGGFANTAGGVLGAYILMLQGHFPNIAAHLISASVLSAPAAFIFAKVMVPEKEVPLTMGEVRMEVEIEDANVLDAVANGTTVGGQLAINVAAMLVSFVAMIAMVNYGIGRAGALVGRPDLTLQMILGWVHAPIALVMGVPWEDCVTVGRFLGEKLILTEFIAYLDLAKHLDTSAMDPRSIVILTYALCGFSNFASIGIQIGGISPLAPSRRHEIARLGFKAMVAGALATFMIACVAGTFYTGRSMLGAG